MPLNVTELNVRGIYFTGWYIAPHGNSGQYVHAPDGSMLFRIASNGIALWDKRARREVVIDLSALNTVIALAK